MTSVVVLYLQIGILIIVLLRYSWALPVTKVLHSSLLGSLEDAIHGVQTWSHIRILYAKGTKRNLTHVEILQRWPEREADEVVAGRVEQVPAMWGVDIEEDARDDNRLLLQQLLEECLVPPSVRYRTARCPRIHAPSRC